MTRRHRVPNFATSNREIPSEVAQVGTGQIDRRWIDKHTELLINTGDLGRDPVYQELHRFVQPANHQVTPSDSQGLTVSPANDGSRSRPSGGLAVYGPVSAEGRLRFPVVVFLLRFSNIA